jgi:hypothetical protein
VGRVGIEVGARVGYDRVVVIGLNLTTIPPYPIPYHIRVPRIYINQSESQKLTGKFIRNLHRKFNTLNHQVSYCYFLN